MPSEYNMMIQSDENVTWTSPQSSENPRIFGDSRVPLQDCNYTNNHFDAITTTPVKQCNNKPIFDACCSPTANLKLLTDLATLKRNHDCCVNVTNEATNSVVINAPKVDSIKPGGRKEKSLGLLCKKFLEKYPEYPQNGSEVEISLDEASKDLNVERRRIYDIVNVLESIEIMCRVAKNCYLWYGKTHLKKTLIRLKRVAISEKLNEQYDAAVCSRVTVSSSSSNENVSPDEIASEDNSVDSNCCLPQPTNIDEDLITIRREKSLGVMSRKFIMLFLVTEPKVIGLDEAAKLLIGEKNAEDKKSTTYKTKIRRLYDIANILTSLNLIQKVHVTERYGRKPAFEYIGPDVDDDDDLVELDEPHPPPPPPATVSRSRIGLKRCLSDSQLRQQQQQNWRKKLPRMKSSETFAPPSRSLLKRHPNFFQDESNGLCKSCTESAASKPRSKATTNCPTTTTTVLVTPEGREMQVIVLATPPEGLSSQTLRVVAQQATREAHSSFQILKLPLYLKISKKSAAAAASSSSEAVAETSEQPGARQESSLPAAAAAGGSNNNNDENSSNVSTTPL